MEGKLPAGSMMTGASYGAISLQGKDADAPSLDDPPTDV